ncbi:MAG: trypco2 family protein [Gemmatimonadales bacterium]
MPGVELKDFIQMVRDEIKQTYEERPSEPILALRGVDLEVSFTLSGKGTTKGKLLVVELEGQLSTERTHKVTLHLVPIAGMLSVEEAPEYKGIDLNKVLAIAGAGRSKHQIP